MKSSSFFRTLLTSSKDKPFLSLEKSQRSWRRSLVSTLGTLLFVLGVRFFIFSPYTVPTGSMIDTLCVGDYLLVTRFDYGYGEPSMPFGYFFLPQNLKRFSVFSRPKPGHVVVFRDPNSSHFRSLEFVKRVIACEGDQVQIRQGLVFVKTKGSDHFQEYTQKQVGPYPYPEKYGESASTCTVFEETLPDGSKHTILRELSRIDSEEDNTEVYTVPEGHYFVMGDNRNHSIDSRFQDCIGFVPFEKLIGRVRCVVASSDLRPHFWMPQNLLPSLWSRKHRFFTWVQ